MSTELTQEEKEWIPGILQWNHDQHPLRVEELQVSDEERARIRKQIEEREKNRKQNEEREKNRK